MYLPSFIINDAMTGSNFYHKFKPVILAAINQGVTSIWLHICPNFRTTNSKVWTVLSTDDILLLVIYIY